MINGWARRCLPLFAGGVGGLYGLTAHAEMVVIREIMAHPPADLPEYLVLENLTATPQDIAHWQVTEGVHYQFPSFASNNPTATLLEAHERIVLSSQDEASTRSAYAIPAGIRLFGPWTGKLSNEGERVTVHDQNGVVVCSVKYQTRGRWPAAANGTGYALALVDPNRRSQDAQNWTALPAFATCAGERGTSFRPARPPSPRLNEVHFSSSGQIDWVELFNPQSTTLSGERLSLATQPDFRDRMGLTGELAARGHHSYSVAFPLRHGEVTVFLLSSSNAILDAQVFVPPKFGNDWQAYPDGSPEWFTSETATRDSANQPPRSTNIVINEIMFAPPSHGAKGEYVELFNRGVAEMDLSGWTFTEGIQFDFPPGTKLPAGGYLVVARDAARLREIYGDVPVVGNFEGRLKSEGETLRLLDQRSNLVSEVSYRTGGDWPEWTHGGGSSLELLNPWMDARRPSAWRASEESGQAAPSHYSASAVYRELAPLGTPADHRELHLSLAGRGHVVLENIALLAGGSNVLASSSTISSNGSGAGGWLCQGSHAGSFITNGQLHLLADARGDDRVNHVEIDAPGLQPGQTCELSFDARWLAGSPRLVAETWDGSFSHSFRLAVPERLGTPGRANSRGLAAAPPQVDDLQHFPAVPRPGETVRISVQVFSAEKLREVRLFHRLDTLTGNGPWQSVPMFDDGRQGGDRVPGDGEFSAELSPRGTNGAVVQFYVQAEATNAGSDQLPRRGAEAPAMFVVAEGSSAPALRAVRLIISASDLDLLAHGDTPRHGYRFPRLSGHYVNATAILDDGEVFYGAQVRQSGSPLTRDETLQKFRLKLPGDRTFRGHTKWVYDDDAAEGKAYHNRVARYLLHLLGAPANENEFVRLMVNAGPARLREEVEPVGNEFLDRNFDKGHQGELYRIDETWQFLDDGEGRNLEATWQYRDDDEAGPYRRSWRKRTRETDDDYSGLIALFKALQAKDASARQLDQWLDPEATLKVAAVRGYIGDWDNFTMQRGRNDYLYRPPGGGKFRLLHWDSDEGFITGQPFYGEAIKPWLEQPGHQRLFDGYLLTLVRWGSQEPVRLKAWLSAERRGSRGAVFQASYLDFFRVREAEVFKWLEDKKGVALGEENPPGR